MKYFTSQNIYYLEEDDFLLYKIQPAYINGRTLFDEMTIVLIQGNYCGYCTRFKPVFQRVADELSMYGDFATIQIDGEQQGEQIFQGDYLDDVLGFPLRGVPLVAHFYEGSPVETYEGDFTYESFRNWVLNQ
jgi:thiol-disulfide isomerase/thioredoxin